MFCVQGLKLAGIARSNSTYATVGAGDARELFKPQVKR
jgi:hypothetical protein